MLFTQNYSFTIDSLETEIKILKNHLKAWTTIRSGDCESDCIAQVIRAIQTSIKQLEQIVIDTNLYIDKIIEQLDSGIPKTNLEQYLQLYEGILFKSGGGNEREWKLMLPEELIDKVIMNYHIMYGHFLLKICVGLLNECWVFKNMGKRVHRLIRSCEIYQKDKIPKKRFEGWCNLYWPQCH